MGASRSLVSFEEDYAIRSRQAYNSATLDWLCKAPLTDEAASPLLFQQNILMVARGQHCDAFVGQHFTTKRSYFLRRYSKRRIYDKKLHGWLQTKINRAQNSNCLWGWAEKPFLNILQSQTHVYLLSQPLVGATLKSIYSMQRPQQRIPERSARFYAAEMLACLYTIHKACGLLVLDVRPANIGVDSAGHVRILDLSNAVPTSWDEPAGKLKPVERPALHQSNIAIDIAPPELFVQPDRAAVALSSRALPSTPWLTEAADWWAFGAALFCMVCGYPPFYSTKHESTETVLANILEGCRVRMPPDVSPAFRSLIIDLLRQEPSRRLTLQEIMQQEWFLGVPWKEIFQRKAVPPFVPQIDSYSQVAKYFPRHVEPHPSPKAMDAHGKVAAYSDAKRLKMPRPSPRLPWDGTAAMSEGRPAGRKPVVAWTRSEPGSGTGSAEQNSTKDSQPSAGSKATAWWQQDEHEGEGPMPPWLVGAASRASSTGAVSSTTGAASNATDTTQSKQAKKTRQVGTAWSVPEPEPVAAGQQIAQNRRKRRRASLESRRRRASVESYGAMKPSRIPGMVGSSVDGHHRDEEAKRRAESKRQRARAIALGAAPGELQSMGPSGAGELAPVIRTDQVLFGSSAARAGPSMAWGGGQ